jgi:hypothetical protein
MVCCLESAGIREFASNGRRRLILRGKAVTGVALGERADLRTGELWGRRAPSEMMRLAQLQAARRAN